MTIEQCRAARGLLGWTQQDLADACGLSKTAINNFEKGNSDIKSESLRAIRMAFESLDIDFIGQDGLKRRTEKSEIIKGSQIYEQLINDIMLNIPTEDNQLIITDLGGQVSNHLNVKKLQDCIEYLFAQNIETKIIAGPTSTLANLPQAYLLDLKNAELIPSQFIYGTKFSEQRGHNPFITITTSIEESAAMKERFNTLWKQANPQTTNVKIRNKAF